LRQHSEIKVDICIKQLSINEKFNLTGGFLMNRKNKRFSALSLILALLLITGAVYAVGTGVLTFTGTADLGDLDLELEITTTNLSGISTVTDGSNGTMVVAGELATFEVELTNPGSEVTFTFNVENSGTLDAFLIKFDMNSGSHGVALDNILEFTGSFLSDLEFQPLAVGDSIDNVTLGVKWKDSALSYAQETIEFTLSIAYMQDI
jgi:hypothetical protein